MKLLRADLFIAVLFLASGTLLLSGCGEAEEPPLWGTGMLEAEDLTLASTVGGRLLARPHEEGDRVREGAVAAWIDSIPFTEQREMARVGLQSLAVQRRQAETKLASAREQLEQAVRARDRLRALREEDAVPQAQLDEAETAATLARQQVRAAELAFESIQVSECRTRLRIASLDRQIRDCRVLVPRSGTVLTVYMEPGEVASPGRAILRLADLDELFVRVYVSADRMGRVRLGGEAGVRADAYPDTLFPGRVAHIAEEAEFTPKNVQTAEARADLVYAVKVSVPNPGGLLKIGLPVEVWLPDVSGTREGGGEMPSP
ncbi:MAG: efflux RND transporter periplasmic adaptor subunit [bacterium]